MAYAETTTVPVTRSISEIQELLRRGGAERMATAEEPGRVAIQCTLNERLLRFAIRFPVLADIPTTTAGGRQSLSEVQRASKLAQLTRQRARALLLVIKAKLESVESGVETFEEAFLPNVVMPDGKTVFEHTQPAIEGAYLGGAPIALLPHF